MDIFKGGTLTFNLRPEANGIRSIIQEHDRNKHLMKNKFEIWKEP